MFREQKAAPLQIEERIILCLWDCRRKGGFGGTSASAVPCTNVLIALQGMEFGGKTIVLSNIGEVGEVQFGGVFGGGDKR